MELQLPPRLAVGSHRRDSGKACLENLMSWINGDETITDLPRCTDRALAILLQWTNDQLCTHLEGDLICVRCTALLLPLGFAASGTAYHDMDPRRVHVRIAAKFALPPTGLPENREVYERIRTAALEWAENPTPERALQVAPQMFEYTPSVALRLVNAVHLPYEAAAVDIGMLHAQYVNAVTDRLERVRRAQEIIDEFKSLTGTVSRLMGVTA